MVVSAANTATPVGGPDGPASDPAGSWAAGAWAWWAAICRQAGMASWVAWAENAPRRTHLGGRLGGGQRPWAGQLVQLADVPVVGQGGDRDLGDVVGVHDRRGHLAAREPQLATEHVLQQVVAFMSTGPMDGPIDAADVWPPPDPLGEALHFLRWTAPPTAARS